MKRILGVLLCVMALFGLTACGNSNETIPDGENTNATANRVLIAYFSCTNTEAIAQHIQAETKGTLYEIVPEVPYTTDDLKYYTNGRADREQADSSACPAISGKVENIEKYGVIFLGYPIWHGQAPKIIYTFLESYDFSGKTIVRWHLQRGVVAIPGSSNPAHILENISVFEFELTESEMNGIAALDRNEKHDWY